MSRCRQCFQSVRIFGYCVACLGPPKAVDTTDPTLRWFLDVLAKREEAGLTDEDCLLIRLAAEGTLTPAHVARREAEERPEPPPAGGYVGTVGERVTAVVKCLSVLPIGTGEYGPRFCITFRTVDTGWLMVWFTGEGGKFDPRPDGIYVITASVKSHAPYNGECQTVIQRPKEEK